MLLYLAIIFEILLSCNFILPEGWESYGLSVEVLLMLWIFVAFDLSSRMSLIKRSIILYFALFQIWTVAVYTCQLLGLFVDFGLLKEFTIGWCGFSWLVLRSYDDHQGSIPGGILKKGLNGDVLILVKKPNRNNATDVLISMFGLPVRTISIYAGGFVYGMDLESNGFVKRSVEDLKGMSSRYGIRLNLDLETSSYIISILQNMIGMKFSWVGNNCTSCLIPIWKIIGFRMPSICYFFPGLFLLGLKLKRGMV